MNNPSILVFKSFFIPKILVNLKQSRKKIRKKSQNIRKKNKKIPKKNKKNPKKNKKIPKKFRKQSQEIPKKSEKNSKKSKNIRKKSEKNPKNSEKIPKKSKKIEKKNPVNPMIFLRISNPYPLFGSEQPLGQSRDWRPFIVRGWGKCTNAVRYRINYSTTRGSSTRHPECAQLKMHPPHPIDSGPGMTTGLDRKIQTWDSYDELFDLLTDFDDQLSNSSPSNIH